MSYMVQTLDAKLSNNEATEREISIVTSTSGSANAFMHTAMEKANSLVLALPIAVGKQNEQSSSSKIEMKQLFFTCY